MRFQWTGINAQGNRVSGVIEASDNKSAHTELSKKGIEVISLTKKNKMQIFSARNKVKPKDILFFTRYLSTMLGAGLPIVQALDIIAKDQENPAMYALITSLKNDISGGQVLAESFSKHPESFNKLYCSLIKAGERSGMLEKILTRIATYLERTENLKQKLKKALIYPTAIVIVAIIVSLILLLFAVPQFETMFKTFGAQLPAFTRLVIHLSNFIRGYWWIFIVAGIAAYQGIKHSLRQSDNLLQLFDKWSLRLPVVGSVLTKGIIARFTRTLAITLEAGMPMVESMRSMPEIMDNRIYAAAITQICDDVSSGHQLSASMTSTNLFPNMVIQMISVGEVSGSLSAMLNKVADAYEEDVNNIVDNLSSLIEPLIMAVLGVIVGGFVIAMYLPIFKIGGLF